MALSNSLTVTNLLKMTPNEREAKHWKLVWTNSTIELVSLTTRRQPCSHSWVYAEKDRKGWYAQTYLQLHCRSDLVFTAATQPDSLYVAHGSVGGNSDVRPFISLYSPLNQTTLAPNLAICWPKKFWEISGSSLIAYCSPAWVSFMKWGFIHFAFFFTFSVKPSPTSTKQRKSRVYSALSLPLESGIAVAFRCVAFLWSTSTNISKFWYSNINDSWLCAKNFLVALD